MGIRNKVGGLAAFITVIAAFCVAAPVQAAVEGIGVSPTSQELDIAPGGTLAGSMTVINDGTSDIIYKVSISDYHVTDESYKADFNSINATKDISAVSWFTLPQTTASVKSGEEMSVPYTIHVPATATIGGHYVAVFAETVPKVGVGNAIARIQKLGSLFYINVSGAVTRDGSIASFKVPWLQNSAPLTATLRMKNSGNVHYAASGEVTVTDLFGKNKAKTVFKGEVLPGTTRRFDLPLNVTGAIGIYKIAVTPHYLEANGPTLSHWVLQIPLLTLVIILGTVGIVIALYGWLLWQRLK
jgi:hypothetical protein